MSDIEETIQAKNTVKQPLLTIAIAAYNVEQYLDTCLTSVENQTDGDFKVLICNDGSTDETLKIAEKWAGKDSRIRTVQHEENKGLAEARNTLLDNTDTEFIFWLDADDTIDREAVKKMKEVQARYNADIVRLEFHAPLPDPVTVLSCGKYMEMLLPNRLRSYMGGSMFRRALFHDLRFPANEPVEDYPVHPLAADRAYHIVVLSEGLYQYTEMRKGSLTETKGKSLPGLYSRGKSSFLRYRRFSPAYPEACQEVLRQAVDYGIITAMLAYPKEPEIYEKMRHFMGEFIDDIESSRVISAYKKMIVKRIIRNAPSVKAIRAAYIAKRKIFGAR